VCVREREYVCECVYVCAFRCMCAGGRYCEFSRCVCVRERERGNMCVCVYFPDVGEECIFPGVCLCVCERESVCVCVCR